MNPLRPAALLVTATALAVVPVAEASAHPLGNFTVNRYDGLVAAPGELRVHHVEDLAEIPATQAAPDLAGLGRAAWAAPPGPGSGARRPPGRAWSGPTGVRRRSPCARPASRCVRGRRDWTRCAWSAD